MLHSLALTGTSKLPHRYQNRTTFLQRAGASLGFKKNVRVSQNGQSSHLCSDVPALTH